MASRNYGMAFDTPYNERLLSVLDKYDRDRDTNGEPDIFSSSMEGGAFLGADGRVHTLPFHPHLSHPMLGSMVREMDGGKFNVGKALGKVLIPVATKVGTKMAEDALMASMMGAGVFSGGMYRPAGMVSPFINRADPNGMVRSGTMATYPVYNAVEMRALEGGAGCCCGMDGGKFNFGKALGSVAKGVGKVGLPIAEKVASKVAEKAVMSALAGAGRPRGRPRKMVDGANSAMGASGAGVGSGGKFNLGKALKKTGKVLGKVAKASAPTLKAVGKEVIKVGLPIAEKYATKMAEKAINDYMKGEASGSGVYSAGVGEMKKPRGRPRSGGKFDILESIKKVGTSAGKPFDKAVGVNPFTLGFDLGHDVIAPAIFGEKKGKGVRSGGGDGRKMRAEIVKKVMKEHGLKMTDASKFVKAHGLY